MSSLTDTDVLHAIARSERCAPEALWIDDGVVWRTDGQGSLRTVCQTGTPYWSWHVAAVLSARVIDRARGAR